MIFSEGLKRKFIKSFINKNINNKLTKDNIKDALKINTIESFWEMCTIIPQLPAMLFLIFSFIIASINMVASKYIDYNVYGKLLFILSIIIPLAPVVFFNIKFQKPLKRSIKKLQSFFCETNNEEKVIESFKEALKNILEDKNSNKELIDEAKDYIIMLKEGKKNYIYNKIILENCFYAGKSFNKSIALQEYHYYCKKIENIKENKNKLISEKDRRNLRIEEQENIGLDPLLEINKLISKS